MRLRAVPLGHPGSGLPAGVCTPGELERAAAILDPVRSREYVAGRLALRCLVAELARTDPRLVVPAYRCPACGPGEHGAPGFALVREAPCAGADTAHDDGVRLPLDVAASVSRAGGWALLAAEVAPWEREVAPWEREAAPWGREVGATPARIGVDLAHVADFRGTLPDAAFTADEGRRVWSAPDPPAEAARLWVRKEALLKAMGTGLRTDPAAVSTSGDPRVRDLDAVELGLPEGFVAAVART
ncbi:4'-phosphopantetheinyl transferase family protein [Sinomonas soli]